MMESFAEAIGIVAQVGVESVGQGVALCLEKEADPVILRERLIDDRGGAVGWDEKREERRLLRLDGERILAVGCKSYLSGLVFLHLTAVFIAKRLMDGSDQVTAQGETAFAR